MNKRKAENGKPSCGGFTLVELIVVIAILGILAGVAYPVYTGYIKRANDAKVLNSLSQVLTTVESSAEAAGVTATRIKVYVSPETHKGLVQIESTPVNFWGYAKLADDPSYKIYKDSVAQLGGEAFLSPGEKGYDAACPKLDLNSLGIDFSDTSYEKATSIQWTAKDGWQPKS